MADPISGAIEGVGMVVGSMIGGRARRREERAAKTELAQRQQAYESFNFTNPAEQMTNAFEDLTVNQQQAQFQAQQQQQGLASTLSSLQGAAGSSGIAALAQAMAGQQAQNLQAASASIGQQEATNQIARAQGQQQLEQARAQGTMQKQQAELARTETLFGMAQQRKAAATAARQQATQDLVGGIAKVGGAVAQVATGVPLPPSPPTQ